eukprot:5590143-Lingulodinium_polyedra.AAC.1
MSSLLLAASNCCTAALYSSMCVSSLKLLQGGCWPVRVPSPNSAMYLRTANAGEPAATTRAPIEPHSDSGRGRGAGVV